MAWLKSRNVRKFVRSKSAVAALAVIAAFCLVAVAVLAFDLITLEETERRVAAGVTLVSLCTTNTVTWMELTGLGAMRVLYMCGFTKNGIVHRGMILDPDRRFIQKPFTERQLVGRIREMLDS